MSDSDAKNCPPDVDAIKAAQARRVTYNLIPVAGPVWGNQQPYPDDASAELDQAKADLSGSKIVLSSLIGKFDDTITAVIQTLVSGLDIHISNIAELLLLPTKHRAITNSISIIFIGLTLGVIIMTLKRKNK